MRHPPLSVTVAALFADTSIKWYIITYDINVVCYCSHHNCYSCVAVFFLFALVKNPSKTLVEYRVAFLFLFCSAMTQTVFEYAWIFILFSS